jgi:hypothetical protein
MAAGAGRAQQRRRAHASCGSRLTATGLPANRGQPEPGLRHQAIEGSSVGAGGACGAIDERGSDEERISHPRRAAAADQSGCFHPAGLPTLRACSRSGQEAFLIYRFYFVMSRRFTPKPGNRRLHRCPQRGSAASELLILVNVHGCVHDSLKRDVRNRLAHNLSLTETLMGFAGGKAKGLCLRGEEKRCAAWSCRTGQEGRSRGE